MSLGLSSGNKLPSHGHWKRQISKATAVQMAKFTASHTEFDASEAMR